MNRPGMSTGAIASISQRTLLISQGCQVWIMMLMPPLIESTMQEHIQSYHECSPGFQTVHHDRSGGQHGCYAPQALVNLFRGEQQKNVDFA